MNLQELLNTEISPKKIFRDTQYYGIKIGRKLKLNKLGPGKCFLLGVALHVAGKTGYWIGKNELSDKNYLEGSLFIASGYLLSDAANISWLLGGYIALRKGYKRLKEKIKEKKDHYMNLKMF